ncbi:anti-sigma factor family protein [Pseudoponticoccus marisrubri]|uniref:Anti-sigma factor n=1 Tax=Pseudoponticoccus marisrubri TaxID=1685382 RepID=A0A0W7WN13_9RHOB|nr:hypothetical protein [Pseudoponticoccus marisrubri]KUF11987.1 hypothetical protein AVJ23_05260 [Pseudoponticoccus marisrubri]
MTLIHLCEIDFYIDGELGPDEACEVEAQLESDEGARALFDALWQQKEAITRALEALDRPSPAQKRTARLQARLAQALYRQLSAARPVPVEVPVLKPS